MPNPGHQRRIHSILDVQRLSSRKGRILSFTWRGLGVEVVACRWRPARWNDPEGDDGVPDEEGS